MELFKDEKEIQKKNSMSDFLFSKDNKNKISNNQSSSSQINSQKNEHKKIPMFGDNNSKNINNNNKSTNTSNNPVNIKPYNVKNPEHQRMLVELESLVDYYMKIFDEEDQKQICFLIDMLKKEL